MYSNFTLGNPKSHFQQYLYIIIDVVSEMGISAVNRVIKTIKKVDVFWNTVYIKLIYMVCLYISRSEGTWTTITFVTFEHC